ncbi:hypothetical protein [Falsiroseomonas sp.]|uniref:hypothetical protein n=1 Tax=Falsiroseomonas sp. TaxID=2870721 RepID=UPI0034A51678
MHRRSLALLPLLAPILVACGADPAASHLGGFGDPVRGAALNAPRLLGDTSRLVGRPAQAALAAVQLEVIADAFRTDPRYMHEVSGTARATVEAGRAELRRAIGIAPEAPPEMVIGQLRDAAAALEGGSRARAEAALTGPAFPAGGAATLARLGRLRFLPRVSEAAGAARAEIGRLDGSVRTS